MSEGYQPTGNASMSNPPQGGSGMRSKTVRECSTCHGHGRIMAAGSTCPSCWGAGQVAAETCEQCKGKDTLIAKLYAILFKPHEAMSRAQREAIAEIEKYLQRGDQG